MTNDPHSPQPFEAELKKMRIVAAALIGGVLIFTFVAALILGVAHPEKWQLPLPFPLPALGLAGAVLATVGSFVLKSVLLGGFRNRPHDPDAEPEPEASLGGVVEHYQKATVASMALCESGAVLLLILAILGGGPLAWLAGVLLPLGGMIFHFPTRMALDRLLDEARRGA